jgi:hypothetical protein
MRMRREAGESWTELGLVFLHPARVGTRRSQRPAFVPTGRERGWAQPQGMDPRELRHSFVSVLSSSGVTIGRDLDRIVNTGGVPALVGSTYGAAKDVGVYVTGEAIRGLADLEAK